MPASAQISLHRGLMEAGPHKAVLGGRENFVPAIRLALNI